MANGGNIQESATVVGVVADVRHRGLTRPISSEVFFPYRQRPQRASRRTREVGTRIALGARPAAVRRLAVPHGMTRSSWVQWPGGWIALLLARSRSRAWYSRSVRAIR
jgi:hypothetical protein